MKGIQLALLGMMMLALPSCYFECDSQAQAQVGGEFFTVTYLDATGGNYLTSVYQPSGIVVYLDTTGGEDPSPEYELINPGYADGKFRALPFTERYIDPTNEVYNDVLLFGRQYDFDYYIRKDTYGVDTFRVSFLLDVDECGSFWRSIRYSRNGDPLPAYDNVRQADIIIVE